MDIVELFEKIKQLKEQYISLLPLKETDEEKLWKKFRLEWNYNSNHIEGNTLTYGQTQLLLIFDKTSGDHEMREFEEMKAHDVAVKMIIELSKDQERPLTENFVRQLNEIILVRPFWKEAITPDGQATRRLIEPGQYKKYPNSVRLQNGEIFNYPKPEEIPALMSDLFTFYNNFKIDSEFDIIKLASLIHYKFVSIHPFDDGNGRVSRLLTNYIFLKYDHPPIIIKSIDKTNYLNALNKADVGDIEAFIKYIAEQLLWSFEISIKAAKNEDIEEPDDLNKRLELIDRKIKSIDKPDIKYSKGPRAIELLIKDVIIPLISKIDERLVKIKSYYASYVIKLSFNSQDIKEYTSFDQKNIISTLYTSIHNSKIGSIRIDFKLIGFKKGGLEAFNDQSFLNFTCADSKYILHCPGFNGLEKLYHENLIEEEVNKIIKEFMNQRISNIEKNMK